MLNEILKEKRKELDLTQQNVADHLNVTRQTVSSWEVGKSFPDISTLIKISDFYQLSLDYMLKGDVNLMKKIKKDTNDLKKYRDLAKCLNSNKRTASCFWLFIYEVLSYGNLKDYWKPMKKEGVTFLKSI